jgi:hypothetical protein
MGFGQRERGKEHSISPRRRASANPVPVSEAAKDIVSTAFYRRTHEAEEASEEISASGAENTLSFSASEFRESSERHVQALISFDYPSRRLEARLLLCPCAVTEIAQPPFRRWRLNLGPDET